MPDICSFVSAIDGLGIGYEYIIGQGNSYFDVEPLAVPVPLWASVALAAVLIARGRQYAPDRN